MLPTSQLNHHWNSPFNVDYSFKQSVSWLPREAASGVTAAAAGAVPPGGPQLHYHHLYGQGRGPWMYRPRIGFFRRFVWFGLGMAAASWYIHSKERKRQREEWINSGAPAERLPMGHGHAWRRFDQTHAPPVPAVSPPAALSEPTRAPVEAAAQVESTPAWGWRERRRPRWEARSQAKAIEPSASDPVTSPSDAVPYVSTGPMDASSSPTAASSVQDEMKKLKEVVEGLWAEKDRAEANEKARVYAREKLDKLRTSLDRLRDSLDAESATQRDKKLV